MLDEFRTINHRLHQSSDDNRRLSPKFHNHGSLYCESTEGRFYKLLSTTSPMSSSIFETSRSTISLPSNKISSPLQHTFQQNILQVNVSAFDFAIREYISDHDGPECRATLRSPTNLDFSSWLGSSSPTYINGETSSPRDTRPKLASEVTPEDDISAWRRGQDPYRTILRRNYVKMQLARCQILLATMILAQSNSSSPGTEYCAHLGAKVRALACKAYGYAEWLQSEGLRARCEYWYGRGSIGMEDWSAAVFSFQSALRHDTASKPILGQSAGNEGLSKEEREQIQHLLKIASRLHNDSCMKQA